MLEQIHFILGGCMAEGTQNIIITTIIIIFFTRRKSLVTQKLPIPASCHQWNHHEEEQN